MNYITPIMQRCACAIGFIIYRLDCCKALYLRRKTNTAVNNGGGYISERYNIAILQILQLARLIH